MAMLFILTSSLSLLVLLFLFFRDRRYRRKPTREVLGRELKREVEEEQKLFRSNKARFEETLNKARKKVR